MEPPGELLTVTLGGQTVAKRRKSGPASVADPPSVYYVPLDPGMPEALARLQLSLPVGTVLRCEGPSGPSPSRPTGPLAPASPRSGSGSGASGLAGSGPAPSRSAAFWPAGVPALAALVCGAGFVVERARRTGGRWVVEARRDRTLPDFVGGGMRMLVCGLNPSVVSADVGFGYAGATNRFWSAAVAAGVVTHPREPIVALAEDRVGMTDLVKRATPNADSLTTAEYQEGAERVRRLVEWLRPGVVLFVGLTGWRAAIDRRAAPGPQPSPFGGAPAYVMPSTSGRNARTTPAELITHLRAALALAAR